MNRDTETVGSLVRPEPPAELTAHRHRLPENARIVSLPVLGGLHHDYRLLRDAA